MANMPISLIVKIEVCGSCHIEFREMSISDLIEICAISLMEHTTCVQCRGYGQAVVRFAIPVY